MKLHVTRITNSTLTWLCRDWSHSRSPQDNLLKTICPMDILSLSFGPFCQQARVTFSQNFNYLKEGRHLSTNSCTQWYRPCLTETRSSIKRHLVSSEYHLQDPFCVIFTKFASRCLLPGRQIFTLWKEGYSNFDKAHRKYNQENQNYNLFVWSYKNTEAEIFTCSTQAPEEESTDLGAVFKNFDT